MIVRHKKRPVAYTERQQLRHDEMPELYSFTRPPTLAETTTTEITDGDVGLNPDPVAQRRAEDYIKAALAYQMKQAERTEAAMKTKRAEIAIAAEQLEISVETAQGIVDEIVRLTARSTSTIGYALH